jgi:hypothetical protein
MVPTPCGLVWIARRRADFLASQERSNSANVGFTTAPPFLPPRQARLLGPGGFERAAAWPFRIGRGINNMEFLIGVVVGFVLGYGVREGMSRYRRARARRQRGYTEL